MRRHFLTNYSTKTLLSPSIYQSPINYLPIFIRCSFTNFAKKGGILAKVYYRAALGMQCSPLVVQRIFHCSTINTFPLFNNFPLFPTILFSLPLSHHSVHTLTNLPSLSHYSPTVLPTLSHHSLTTFLPIYHILLAHCLEPSFKNL